MTRYRTPKLVTVTADGDVVIELDENEAWIYLSTSSPEPIQATPVFDVRLENDVPVAVFRDGNDGIYILYDGAHGDDVSDYLNVYESIEGVKKDFKNPVWLPVVERIEAEWGK